MSTASGGGKGRAGWSSRSSFISAGMLIRLMYFSGQMEKADPPKQDWISIGELSKRTGIGVDTLRVWEKRYGEPTSRRLPSGHRRYAPDLVPRLRKVADAIAMGERPGRLFQLEASELEALVEPSAPARIRTQDKLIRLVREYRGREVEQELKRSLHREGLEAWILGIVGPLLERVGRDWAERRLDVRHEHFLSQILGDILRQYRLAKEAESKRKRRRFSFLMTTLEGERHELGLQIAAALIVEHGFTARILGCETPIPDILGAIEETGCDTVGISVSLSSAGTRTDRRIRELRESLPAEIRILVGGSGAKGPRKGIAGVTYTRSVDDLVDYLEERE